MADEVSGVEDVVLVALPAANEGTSVVCVPGRALAAEIVVTVAEDDTKEEEPMDTIEDELDKELEEKPEEEVEETVVAELELEPEVAEVIEELAGVNFSSPALIVTCIMAKSLDCTVVVVTPGLCASGPAALSIHWLGMPPDTVQCADTVRPVPTAM